MKEKNIVKKGRIFFFAIIFSCLFSNFLFSQEEYVYDENVYAEDSAPTVYLDCSTCDIDYIKEEIKFVDYVRFRKDAQVYILITTLPTGGGGLEHTVEFTGRDKFTGIDETLKYYSTGVDTWHEIRKGLVRTLKIGLMRYIGRSPLAERISITYKEDVPPIQVQDKWNSWVFKFYCNGSFNSEKTYDSQYLSGSFSADRVTDELKTKTSLSYGINKDKFKIGDETLSSTQRTKGFNSYIVKSINENWSAGGFVRAFSSTYENMELSASLAPAIEYNYFPYSEYTKRQLRFIYKLGYESARYIEETLYDKTSEDLFYESFSIELKLKQDWGDASLSLSTSHYFHDTQKYNAMLNSNLSVSLFNGFSIFFSGGYSRIHDRLSIPKEGATLEEILLRRKLLETDYRYWFSIGFSYTFGSTSSGEVNPRFGV